MEGNTSKTTPEATDDKKGRVVDYSRTDKTPHSFRYKRHSTFVPRDGVATSLSKDSDGAYVIGPAPVDAQPEAATLAGGSLELVQIRKRPNGQSAIAFKHAELGTVVAYDARSARAALKKQPALRRPRKVPIPAPTPSTSSLVAS